MDEGNPLKDYVTPFFETHHTLICPICLKGCHALYVIGKHPTDSLGCKNCYKDSVRLATGAVERDHTFSCRTNCKHGRWGEKCDCWCHT
jgi:hypothetical protein